VYSSPLERAIETAEAIARPRGLAVLIREELNEIDFGSWTGLTFHALSQLPEWQQFNAARATARVPGGARATDAQVRIVRALERLRDDHPAETVAVVSHADLIRAAVLSFTGTPLDLYHIVEIHPASITEVHLNGDGASLAFTNRTDT
jgi:broad specificity phosphatase PhoE